MENCMEMQEAVSRLVDGELDAAEEAALRAHLESCPDCRALYESFTAFSEALRGGLEEPPASLREAVMATLRREELARRNRRPLRVLASLAAVAALVLGLRLALPLRSAEPSLSAAVRLPESAQGAVLAEESEGEAVPARDSLLSNRSAAFDAASESAAQAPTLESLLDFLAGEALPEDAPLVGETASVRLADGWLSLCGEDGSWRYRAGGTLYQSARSLAEIEAFLAR